MKKILVPAALLGVALLLVNCSGKREAAGSGADRPKTVSIFHHIGEQSGRDSLQSILDKLNAKNPGVVYEQQGIDYGQYGDMLKTRIAGGDIPDIIYGRPLIYADLIRAGHIMALDGQPFLDKVQESAMASMMVDGKTYAIPTGLSTMGVYYNKQVFANHAVAVPQTHEQLMEAARKFQAAGIYPFSHGFKEGWMAQADFQSDFYGAPLRANPLFYSEIIAGTKMFANYLPLRESLVRYVDRLSFEGGDDFGTDAAAARANLLNGKAAMMVSGNWELSEFTRLDTNRIIGFFTTPNSPDGVPILDIAPDGCYMIAAQSPNKAEGLRFLEFLCSPEGAAMLNYDGTQLSVVKGAPTDNVASLTADILAIADTGATYNFEAQVIFSGERDAAFRAWQEEVSTDPNPAAIDAFIERLDRNFAAIQ
jgi:raffinose/stachyose/melibiose transport system substrate-binding protein